MEGKTNKSIRFEIFDDETGELEMEATTYFAEVDDVEGSILVHETNAEDEFYRLIRRWSNLER